MVVVEGGNVLHHVKREGELSGRVKCPGGACPRGKCPGGMFYTLPDWSVVTSHYVTIVKREGPKDKVIQGKPHANIQYL